MYYLLDTSILIDLLRNKKPPEQFIADHPMDTFGTSTICEAEVYEGIYREDPASVMKKKVEFTKLLDGFEETSTLTSDQAELAGKIRALLSKTGSLIGDLDILIAACALANDATLWTKNPSHFSKISGINILPLA